MSTEVTELPTLEQVRTLIAERPATVKLKHIATAANCSMSWLKQIRNGEIKNPSYEKVKAILAFLNSKRAA